MVGWKEAGLGDNLWQTYYARKLPGCQTLIPRLSVKTKTVSRTSQKSQTENNGSNCIPFLRGSLNRLFLCSV